MTLPTQQNFHLVERNIHEISVDSRRLLFHIPSSSLFQLDELSGELIDLFKKWPDRSPDQVLHAMQPRFEAADISTTFSELQSLEVISNGQPLTPETAKLTLTNFPLTTLVLNVNTGCNLSCSYCYKEDLATPANGEKMSLETATQSIEMLLKESPDQPRYNLVFFGGEPLSNLPLIKQVVEFAEHRFAAIGKKVDFSMTTNATLLKDDVIDYLNQHRFGIAVSMDGPKAFHDRNRITVGGQGTYDVVADKVRHLLQRYDSRPVGARVTLTKGVTDIMAIWDHLFNDLGFHEVGFAPVTSGDIDTYNLSEAELAQVFSNMKELGQRYLEAALQNHNIGFSNMHQLMTDIFEGNKKALPCGAGAGMVAIDKDGGVNLCHRFTGSDMPLFGDVKQGLNHQQLSRFLEQRMDRTHTGCNSCRIRNLCSGGCYHESYARYNDPSKPTYHYCDLLRDWVDFGIHVYSEIMAHNPAFFEQHISPRTAH